MENIEETFDDFENLDTDWIKEYKDIEELYSDFYKEELTVVSVYFLYINRNSELFHIKKDIIDL